MTITTCDICGGNTNDGIKVRFRDGEHPHNGSIMYKNADVCRVCIYYVTDLSSNSELDDLVEQIKNYDNRTKKSNIG